MMRQTMRQSMMLVFAIGLATSLEAQPGGRPPKGGNNTLVAAPTGVAVTSNASALTVSWTNVANASGYQVNRREGGSLLVTLASGLPSAPYAGALPPPGAVYEYQVVAFSGKNKAASPWVAYTVPASVPTPGTPGVIVVEPRPGTGGTITPIVVPAGPAYLNVGSAIPGQIWLNWKVVPNATAYRIMRSSNAPEAERAIKEISAASQLPEAGYYAGGDAPVDNRFTFTYKVIALFGTTASTPSPSASASSAPFVQPTGLTYSAVPSVTKLGTLNVTVSWNAVANAEKYTVSGTGFTGQAFTQASSTSLMFPGLPPRTTFTGICVSTVYPFSVTTTTGAPCIDVKL